MLLLSASYCDTAAKLPEKPRKGVSVAQAPNILPPVRWNPERNGFRERGKEKFYDVECVAPC